MNELPSESERHRIDAVIRLLDAALQELDALEMSQSAIRVCHALEEVRAKWAKGHVVNYLASERSAEPY